MFAGWGRQEKVRKGCWGVWRCLGLVGGRKGKSVAVLATLYLLVIINYPAPIYQNWNGYGCESTADWLLLASLHSAGLVHSSNIGEQAVLVQTTLGQTQMHINQGKMYRNMLTITLNLHEIQGCFRRITLLVVSPLFQLWTQDCRSIFFENTASFSFIFFTFLSENRSTLFLKGCRSASLLEDDRSDQQFLPSSKGFGVLFSSRCCCSLIQQGSGAVRAAIKICNPLCFSSQQSIRTTTLMQQPPPYAVIAIKDPVLQTPPNDNLPAYVTYLVSGVDPHGEFNIRRRFREFLALRNKLVERFIGIYIPPLPSKRASGNTQESYVEERRKFLHYFCLKMAKRPFLFDSDVFQTFIRGDPDFERAARLISGREYALIANIYDVEFRKEVEQSDMLQVVTRLEAEGQALKIVERTLVSLKNQMQEAVEARRQLLNEFRECYRDILPRFEDQIMKKHDPQQEYEFFTNNHIYHQKMKAYLHLNESNILKDFIQTLNYDIREARAFLQAIQTRRYFMDKKVDFQSARRQSKEELEKLKSGRMTLRSVFSIGGKDNLIKDLQNHIPQFERNEIFLDMCLPLSAISIQRDLTDYKKNRSIIYLANLQIIVQKQMKLINAYGDILKSALTYSDLHFKQASKKRAEAKAKLQEERERERREDPTAQVEEIEVKQVAKDAKKRAYQQEQDLQQERDHVDELK